MKDLQRRIDIALFIIAAYGSVDGAHHKDWVIDQVTRALTGPDYGRFVAGVRAGEDGPETYPWSEGIEP